MRVLARRYTPEFRADAVALLRRSDQSIAEIAARLGGTPAPSTGMRSLASARR